MVRARSFSKALNNTNSNPNKARSPTNRKKMSPLCACLVFCLAAITSASSTVVAYPRTPSSLKVGYYWKTCPHAETIVRQTVSKAVARNRGIAASLIRMHFHDCFVRGCDGSILLDSKPGRPAEKHHPANNPSIIGFEVIDKAKAKIEALCPNTVSCADIIAFAARDSAYMSGLFYYAVPGGRRDGRVSLESEVNTEIPPSFFNAKQLKENFARKGMSVDEMVTLSGAHSFGVTHCSSFANRLRSFNDTHPQDPSLNTLFAKRLKAKCPAWSSRDGTVPLDIVTPYRLDNVYYKNLIHGKGVLTSDQALFSDPSTSWLVKDNALRPVRWATKFASAMVRMGSIDVLTGINGEIRKNCRVVNY